MHVPLLPLPQGQLDEALVQYSLASSLAKEQRVIVCVCVCVCVCECVFINNLCMHTQDGFSGYEFEARLNFKVHSALSTPMIQPNVMQKR